jgi:hypothetical protein
MRYLSRNLCTLTLVSALCATAAAAQQAKPQTPAPAAVNADAATLQDFKERLDRYIQLQRKTAKDSLPQKETANAAEITAAEEVLAAKIIAIRKDAKPGDIFTPQVRALFRRLMYPELHGEDGPETKEIIKGGDDAPPAVPLKVNGKYPAAAPLPTVPTNLLVRLPQLPKDVEYRIVGKNLLLRDVDANIIVDFIPNAIR